MERSREQTSFPLLPVVFFCLASALAFVIPEPGAARQVRGGGVDGKPLAHDSARKQEGDRTGRNRPHDSGRHSRGHRSVLWHGADHRGPWFPFLGQKQGPLFYCQAERNDGRRYDREEVPYYPYVRRYEEEDKDQGRRTYGYELNLRESDKSDTSGKIEESVPQQESRGPAEPLPGKEEGGGSRVQEPRKAEPSLEQPGQGGRGPGEPRPSEDLVKGGSAAGYKWISVPRLAAPPPMESAEDKDKGVPLPQRARRGPDLPGSEPYGRVVFDVLPLNSEIYIDGKYMGKAETLNNKRILVKPGDHDFLFKAGETSVSIARRVEADSESSLSRDLRLSDEEVLQ